MNRPTCENTFLVRKRNLKNQYYSLVFGPYTRAAQCRPGQFVHIKLASSDVFFRRAFSVAAVAVEQSEIEIILKVVGRGTQLLSRLHRGEAVDLLGPLGTPFKFPRKSERAVLVAGGVGFPPLLFLASEMIEKGFNPRNIEFFYGGCTSKDVIERSRIRQLGVNLIPVTEDGSLGEQGLVTRPVERLIASRGVRGIRIYACGPEGMLKAVNDLGSTLGVKGQLSLEAPMPCGIGVCLGCVVPLVRGGYARVCCDGPVFDIGEVAL